MTDQNKDKVHENQTDVPLTDAVPDDRNELVEGQPLPEITDGGRDPSRVPAKPGQKTPNLKPNDEQLAAEKEVNEGIDRAEDDQRRAARNEPDRRGE